MGGLRAWLGAENSLESWKCWVSKNSKTLRLGDGDIEKVKSCACHIDALIFAELQGTLPAPILGAVLPVPNAPAAPAGLPVPPVATAIASSTAQQVAGVVHQLINQVMQAMECWMMGMCGYLKSIDISLYICYYMNVYRSEIYLLLDDLSKK